jgi:hypothetical protein
MNSNVNYSGKQPNNTAYIKNYVPGNPTSLWKTMTYVDSGGNKIYEITPTSSVYKNLYIPGNLYLDGTIITPSDAYLKDKIEDLHDDISVNLMKLRPTQFVFKSDTLKSAKHYGFIAQEFEEVFPELVASKVDKNVANLKAINYLEIVPLLVYQIQKMQKEIDELKSKCK